MSAKRTSESTRRRSDVPYDPNDKAAVDMFWKDAITHTGLDDLWRKRGQRGAQKAPVKQLVSLRLSPDVVAAFRATGPGWQTRMDEALRKAAGLK